MDKTIINSENWVINGKHYDKKISIFGKMPLKEKTSGSPV